MFLYIVQMWFISIELYSFSLLKIKAINYSILQVCIYPDNQKNGWITRIFSEYTKSKITKLPYVAKVYPCFMKCSLEKPHVSSELVLWVKTFRMKKKTISFRIFILFISPSLFMLFQKKSLPLFEKNIFLKKTKSLLFVCLHAASTNINPK